MYINGFNIICDPHKKVVNKVRRTWRERLFTLPFKPFDTHKDVIEWVDALEDDQIIRSGNKLVCNTKTYEKIRKQGI